MKMFWLVVLNHFGKFYSPKIRAKLRERWAGSQKTAPWPVNISKAYREVSG
jgi:hypothetical protein